MNLIVGGTGFIGGHLAEYLLQEGEISKGIFRKGSHLRILDQCGVQCLEADTSDRKTLHEPLEMVTAIYNLVSPTPRNSEADYGGAIPGLRNLLEEAEEHGVKVFVHLSTLDVFGFGRSRVGGNGIPPSPSHPYQRAKLEAERVVLDFGREKREMRVVIVRAARAMGSRDTTLVVPLLRMMERKRVLLPAGSTRTMSFTHPKDIAQALLRAASLGSSGEAYSIKSFDATPEEVALSLTRACGRDAEVRRRGILSGKGLLPAYTEEQLKAALTVEEQPGWKTLGYSPAFTLERTVSEIADWYRKEPWVTE